MPTVLPAVPSSSGRRLKKLKKRVKKKSKKEDKKNQDTDTTNSTSPELLNDNKEKVSYALELKNYYARLFR